MTLEEKLAAFDAEARAAYTAVVTYLLENRDDLIALARARHVEGHDRYGDGNLFEWDDERLAVERDEELADSVVYEVRRRTRGAALAAVLFSPSDTTPEEGS